MSGWTLESVTATESALAYEYDALALWNTNSPLQDIIDLIALSLNRDPHMLKAQVRSNVDRKIVSRVNCDIAIKRNSTFYVMNYIVTIAIFTILSLCSFFIDQNDIQDRCATSLTVILAINVYQLILNDNMPETGYLTRMVIFIFVSTTFVSFTIIEAILVYISLKALEIDDKRIDEETKVQNIGKVLQNSNANTSLEDLETTIPESYLEVSDNVKQQTHVTVNAQKSCINSDDKRDSHPTIEQIEEAFEDAMEDASKAVKFISVSYHRFMVQWMDMLSICFFTIGYSVSIYLTFDW